MSAVVLLVELTLQPGRREDFLARVRRHRDTVLAEEPGCERFDVVLPEESGDTVYLYEVYADEAALEHHAGTPYMAAYRDDTGPMIADRKRTKCSLAPG